MRRRFLQPPGSDDRLKPPEGGASQPQALQEIEHAQHDMPGKSRQARRLKISTFCARAVDVANIRMPSATKELTPVI